MINKLDLRLPSGASVWDAWVYGCMINCRQSADCPCLPYRLGDVPPHYPVPCTMDDAVLACIHNPKALHDWTIPWFKRALRQNADF